MRFLNDVGGGVVSRTESDKLLFVLDEDGFEIPAVPSDVVLVEKKADSSNQGSSSSVSVESDSSYEFEESDDEGEPKLMLAYVRDMELTGNVKLFLINDSNFFAFYTIGRLNKTEITNAYQGQIEPNTKINLDNVAINYIDGVEYECQIMLFRKSVAYTSYPPIVEKVKQSGVKLLKGSSYISNDYLQDKAIVVSLIKGSFEQKLEELSAKDIKKVIREKESVPAKKKQVRKENNGILEVDLHIHELLDDTRGLSNKDMLEYQMAKFYEVMNENKNNKNKKIVFIHGKGNGVLKSEILKSLSKKYTWHSYQDASFKEYGYGATMVTI